MGVGPGDALALLVTGERLDFDFEKIRVHARLLVCRDGCGVRPAYQRRAWRGKGGAEMRQVTGNGRQETGSRRQAAESLSPDTCLLDPDDFFATKLDAWQYLQDSGWQIGRSQFYEHCKQGRLPRKDGRYLRADVDRYAQHHCRAADTGEKVNEKLSRIAEEKIETELARDKTRLEKELMELAIKRGEYVPRDEVEQMIVGRAVALLAHLRAMAAMKASDFIALVAGDQRRQRDLIDALNENIEDYVAIFAKDIEFEVIFEKNE